MNKTFFLIIYCITLALTLAVLVISLKGKNKLGRVLTCLLGAASLSIACNVLILSTNNYMLGSIGNSLMFAALDWLCFCLFRFAMLRTDYNIPQPLLLGIFYALVVDTIVMLINPFHELAMHYEVVQYGSDLYLTFKPLILYCIHLTLCYVLIAAAIYFLIWKICRIPAVYRPPYYYVIAAILFVVAVNLVYLTTPILVDYSYISYAFAAMFLYRMTYHGTPVSIERNIQRLMTEHSSEAIIIYNIDGLYCYSNLLAKKLFDKNVTLSYRDFDSQILFDYCFANNEVTVLELKTHTYQVRFSKLNDNKDHNVASYLTFHDITNLEQMNHAIEYTANHDDETGLLNKQAFFKEVTKNISVRDGKDYAICSVDIAKYNKIIEIYGFEYAVQLQIKLATMLEEICTVNNFICGRITSDKFAVWSRRHDMDISSFISMINNELCRYSSMLPITLKVGIYIGNETNIDKSYEKALRALKYNYSCDEPFIVYNDSLLARVEKENLLLADFEYALYNREFVIYLQPQIDSSTDKLTGAEALVRWKHPKYGIVPPDVFIPMLEQNQLIHRLDYYVWEETCRVIAALQHTRFSEIPISINVSLHDFYHTDLPRVLASLAEQYHIDNNLLRIEITESAFMDDRQYIISTINKLKEEGFLIEMDDFGSGYSSLNTLKEIPCDIVKLDMRFMMGESQTEKATSILRDIIRLMINIGLPIIAEGVETKEQVDMLASMGCHTIQGYYYSKPVPFEEFVEMNR